MIGLQFSCESSLGQEQVDTASIYFAAILENGQYLNIWYIQGTRVKLTYRASLCLCLSPMHRGWRSRPLILQQIYEKKNLFPIPSQKIQSNSNLGGVKNSEWLSFLIYRRERKSVMSLVWVHCPLSGALFWSLFCALSLFIAGAWPDL